MILYTMLVFVRRIKVLVMNNLDIYKTITGVNLLIIARDLIRSTIANLLITKEFFNKN